MSTLLAQPFRSNAGLALRLTWRSLLHHRMVALATVLGVALGMCVVSAVLIVDFNTALDNVQKEQLEQQIAQKTAGAGRVTSAPDTEPPVALRIDKIAVLRQHDGAQNTDVARPLIPTQKAQLSAPIVQGEVTTAKGEEDYQAMRLAIRMASLLAFFIGAVIVFYTMRFSVSSRQREFSLLLCLGEYRTNVAIALIIEAGLLGLAGTLLGLLMALPLARLMLALGISTTGRVPLQGFALPVLDLTVVTLVSVTVALLGVIAPLRSLYRLHIAEVLQPRFMTQDVGKDSFRRLGLSWLLLPLLIMSYIALRPFVQSWLSVVQFFLFEAVFVVLVTAATLWWVRPFLKIVIAVFERLLQPVFPLETLLTGRRMRLTSEKIVFSITGVVLVFSLLTGLHGITRALKGEITAWADEAMSPYYYFKRQSDQPLDRHVLETLLAQHDIYFFRLSAKLDGSFPMRLIHSADLNPYRLAQGKPPFGPGEVIFSKTLAARMNIRAGDTLSIEFGQRTYEFDVIEVADDVGFFADNGQYVNLKSYALFSEGNPLFAHHLEQTLGDFGMARHREADRPLQEKQRDLLYPAYRYSKSGRTLKYWQVREIDRDFLIFNFVLIMTVALACIGIVNTLLIQVHAREREFAVLRTIGMKRTQLMRLLLIEGVIIGLVGALLSIVLGNALGLISVSFLDQFTLFNYRFIWSNKATAAISALTLMVCCVAAIYPALVATRTSSAESLHYE